MNTVPETTIYEVLFSRICSVFPMGKNVDIVGVTGSIPVTPTILSPVNTTGYAIEAGLFTKYSLGSSNLGVLRHG